MSIYLQDIHPVRKENSKDMLDIFCSFQPESPMLQGKQLQKLKKGGLQCNMGERLLLKGKMEKPIEIQPRSSFLYMLSKAT